MMRPYDMHNEHPEHSNGTGTPLEARQEAAVFPGSEGSLPTIGIPLPVQQGKQGPELVADAVGAWAVERMGGRVLLLPLWPFPPHQQMYHSLWQLVPLIDGLLLPAGVGRRDGGGDPNGRAEESEAEHWARAWESALVQLVTYLGMPLLAIAEGASTWNRALGGTDSEARPSLEPVASPPPASWRHHAIRVRARSSLALTLQTTIRVQEDQLSPWSLAVVPGPQVQGLALGLSWCAQSEEGTPVAFERRDGIFGLGVLGRLDWGLDQVYSRTIFAAFLQACRAFNRSWHEHPGWEAACETICATVAQRAGQGLSLIAGHAILSHQPSQSSEPRPVSIAIAREPKASARVRQRSHVPTKAELNRIRRQRLKPAAH